MLPKQLIADLGQLLKLYGTKHVVICPGSRNAPLIQVFTRDETFHCHSIVDERSAGYLALGMARESGIPTAVITTSGTAALNLAPSTAEAYYQEIPLLLITADRPPGALEQGENQTINQDQIFGPNCKGSYSLPPEVSSEEERRRALEIVVRALDEASRAPCGPVHLNIPLEEPLYKTLPDPGINEIQSVIPDGEFKGNTGPGSNQKISVSGKHAWKPSLTQGEKEKLRYILDSTKRILILPGMQSPSKVLKTYLSKFSDFFGAPVLAENISNLTGSIFYSHTELLLGTVPEEYWQQYYPELVLTFGGHIISKRLRKFLNLSPGCEFWHISPSMEIQVNPYHALGKVINSDPAAFFSELPGPGPKATDGKYMDLWRNLHEKITRRSEKIIIEGDFGNLPAMHAVLSLLPPDSTLHLGNSGIVRYAQLLPSHPGIRYFANRGTSGIDGCLSSAVGAAMVSDGLHVAILGDLSFIYDSNGMWNRDFPANLRIIVLNDEGGGIFRIIEGPSKMPFFEEFSVANHPVSIKKLVEAYGLVHRDAESRKDLLKALPDLFLHDRGPAVLEIKTGKCENSAIFKSLFRKLQEQYHAEQGMEDN